MGFPSVNLQILEIFPIFAGGGYFDVSFNLKIFVFRDKKSTFGEGERGLSIFWHLLGSQSQLIIDPNNQKNAQFYT